MFREICLSIGSNYFRSQMSMYIHSTSMLPTIFFCWYQNTNPGPPLWAFLFFFLIFIQICPTPTPHFPKNYSYGNAFVPTYSGSVGLYLLTIKLRSHSQPSSPILALIPGVPIKANSFLKKYVCYLRLFLDLEEQDMGKRESDVSVTPTFTRSYTPSVVQAQGQWNLNTSCVISCRSDSSRLQYSRHVKP